MGKPAIPPYGKDFYWEPLAYHPELASRAYVLRADPAWFIRADRTSEHWQIYRKTPGTGANWSTATPMGKPQDTFRAAMKMLLDGIAQGFYITVGESSR